MALRHAVCFILLRCLINGDALFPNTYKPLRCPVVERNGKLVQQVVKPIKFTPYHRCDKNARKPGYVDICVTPDVSKNLTDEHFRSENSTLARKNSKSHIISVVKAAVIPPAPSTPVTLSSSPSLSLSSLSLSSLSSLSSYSSSSFSSSLFSLSTSTSSFSSSSPNAFSGSHGRVVRDAGLEHAPLSNNLNDCPDGESVTSPNGGLVRMIKKWNNYKCYELWPLEAKPYDDALNFCRANSGYLNSHGDGLSTPLVIESEDESRFLFGFYQDVFQANSAWLNCISFGIDDVFCKTYRDTYEEPIYTEWSYDDTYRSAKPNQKRCIGVSHLGAWGQYSCDDSLYVICQKYIS